MLLYCNISAILIRCKGGTPASWSMFLISTGMQNVQVCNKVVTWQTWIANEWLDLFCHNKSDVATHQICQSGSKDLILIRLLHEVKKKVWFISTKCAKSLGIANFLKLCSFKEILFNFAGVSYFVLSEFWSFFSICPALATATSLKPLNRI